jgi:glutamate 5-kinase
LAKKLNAAKHVNAHSKSIPFILMPYNQPYAIYNIFDRSEIDGICVGGEYPGFTIFINSLDVSLPVEKRHMSGKIIIDDNAEKSLLNIRGENNSSLLSVGIVAVEGDFDSKAVVAIHNQNSVEIGRGVVNLSSQDIAEAITNKNSLIVINRRKMRIKT